jgi:hypothetical protein
MPNSEDGRKRIDALNEWKDRGESDEVGRRKGYWTQGGWRRRGSSDGGGVRTED